jgi:hypothetical protein
VIVIKLFFMNETKWAAYDTGGKTVVVPPCHIAPIGAREEAISSSS